MFRDRIEAGYELANRLQKYKNADGVVLAVPKGGVPVGFVVATELGLPLDLILSKKIGHPLNKEYAIGAVSPWGSFIIPHEDVTQAYIARETQRIRQNLAQLQERLNAGREPVDIGHKVVIVIDDGIATGNTLLATIGILKKHHPERIIVAVPVSSHSAYQRLSSKVDELLALYIPDHFSGVGAYFDDFSDVSEEEVAGYLARAREHAGSSGSNTTDKCSKP